MCFYDITLCVSTIQPYDVYHITLCVYVILPYGVYDITLCLSTIQPYDVYHITLWCLQYRRDEIDSSHYPIFHQMEGVRVPSTSIVNIYYATSTHIARY